MICPICNNEIVQPSRGRKKKYCSDGCRYEKRDTRLYKYRENEDKAVVECQGYNRHNIKCKRHVEIGWRGRPYPFCSHECYSGSKRVGLGKSIEKLPIVKPKRAKNRLRKPKE